MSAEQTFSFASDFYKDARDVLDTYILDVYKC